MPAIVGTYRTLDCANKVRIHYLLAQPVTTQLLSKIPDVNLEVHEFSKLIKGAKDHFVLTRSNRFRATGSVGEAKIVATFGKVSGHCVDLDIDEFEQQLGILP